MNFNNFSDYGSGSSSETLTSWGGSHETWPEFRSMLQEPDISGRRRSSSFTDVTSVRSSIDDIMQEFKLNGSDSPYDPEEEEINKRNRALVGMGPSSTWLRQMSWPAPEATPAVRLPRPMEVKRNAAEIMLDARPAEVSTIPEALPILEEDVINEQQIRVLNSLPNNVLYTLLKQLEQQRVKEVIPRKQEDMECRFCKNNGERPSYYRSHRLRARGRVACPVLRALRCRRCGARGDHAHTLKYCPLATDEERKRSVAMMRCVRMASSRHRKNANATSLDVSGNYVVFGEATPTMMADGAVYNNQEAPLDPIWEELEKKLMF